MTKKQNKTKQNKNKQKQQKTKTTTTTTTTKKTKKSSLKTVNHHREEIYTSFKLELSAFSN